MNKSKIKEIRKQVRSSEIEELKLELEWYRAYSSYINCYHKFVDAEASEYADQEQNNND